MQLHTYSLDTHSFKNLQTNEFQLNQLCQSIVKNKKKD